MTYVLISLPFLLGAIAVWAWRGHRLPAAWATTGLVMAVILILTAIFDNLMIAAGLVEYGSAQNLGVRVGLVPVEDFFYAVFVVLLITALWKGTDDPDGRNEDGHDGDG